ncbi:MAG TPA: hypothetical protein PLU30_00620 [Verrucomicrobiae bacterium]|nr:hypothetical protein [Verrucomicrobiae bacterium]
MTRASPALLGVCLILAVAAEAEEIHFDFEGGNLGKWEITESGFEKLVSDRAVMFHGSGRYAKQGRYHLSTLEDARGGVSDGQMGVVESPDFILCSPEITFLIAGGSSHETRMALCSAADGTELMSAGGRNSQAFRRETFKVSPDWVGRPLCLRVVDQKEGGWGHILVDDITFHGALVPLAESNAASRRARLALEKEIAAINANALRAAIDDIGTSFSEYPAPGFIGRLEALERCRAELADGRGEAGVATTERWARLAADYRALKREAMLANPLLCNRPILFTTRRQYARDHHNTETIFLTGECNTSKYVGGGALKAIDLASGGAVRTIFDAGADGLPRDPDISFDGKRILFSMRGGMEDDYHIYEINADGSGMRPLTGLAGAADIDPIYLPDGGIVFSSTREPKYCGCNQHIMANLYRMDGDGANIIRIGGSTLFEGHSRLLPDGRILYDRWEYVDRDFGDAQGLWTVNPDGTCHAIYWGNNTPSPGGVIQARPVPGADAVIAVLGACHDRPWGALGIIDRRRALDADGQGRSAVLRTWPASAMEFVGNGGIDTFAKVRPRYQDPYPLSEKYFLCSREIADLEFRGEGEKPEMGIYLVDVFGNETLVHAEKPACFSPVPIAPRTKPPMIPVRRDYGDNPATVYVMDAYQGTHMQGVRRGDIRWMRVVESPEKRHWTAPAWGGQGVHRPAMNWHNFENKRILGTVPVEEDGSVVVEIPPDKFVFFQLLDKDGRMIHSMRSGVVFQSGERASCIGCHEHRLAPPPLKTAHLGSSGKAPAKLDGWRGPSRLYSYVTEMQPVWDKHCVSCHDFGKPAGSKLVLAGDRDLFFNASYESLHQRWRKPDGYLTTVGAGPAQIQQAFSWGSRASRLVAVLRAGHNDVRLDDEDWDRINTWLDLNAPYYPSYATAYPSNLVGRSPLDDNELKRLAELTGVNFQESARWDKNSGPLISFDRPELSPCLADVSPGGEAYDGAIGIIRAGQERLRVRPRGDTCSFEPCAKDREREAKYQARRELELRNRAAVRNGTKVYDADALGPIATK